MRKKRRNGWHSLTAAGKFAALAVLVAAILSAALLGQAYGNRADAADTARTAELMRSGIQMGNMARR